MKHENRYQSDLITLIERRFPGAVILKNDANYIQGIPDLLILYKDKWAVLECKKSLKEPHQPNQDYYIALLNGMSYAAFVYPENEDIILAELETHFMGY